MLTENEFLRKLDELDICLYSREVKNHHTSMIYRKGPATLDRYLEAHWVSGGRTGGSCWDEGEDDRHYAVTADKEPELADLDKVLMELVPDLSFIQYRKLMQEVIEYGDYSEDEYYGNYTCYNYKCVQLRKLYDWLKNQGHVVGRAAGKRQDAPRKRASKSRG